MSEIHFESVLVDPAILEDKASKSVNTPIYLTSTFRQEKIRGEFDWEYSRSGNPTRAVLEQMIAKLENGKAGFAFASGMAAITTVLSLLKSGDKVLIINEVYGGTFRLLDKIFSQFGIEYGFANTESEDALNVAFSAEVKAVLIESPSNPLLTVTDIELVAKVAHEHGAILIVDNTFMTPYLQQPLNLGADIVIHSATKYLGGHSDLIAGLAVTSDANIAKKLAFLSNATGAILDPFDSFLLLRGIKTLAVRMDRHIQNAQEIATWLNKHPRIKKVYYPGFEDAQGYEIQKKQARHPGAMISFEMQDDSDVNRFIIALKRIAYAESLGGVESLVCHPASMSHASVPIEEREKMGIKETLIRLSVGIENVEDLIFDLENALAVAKI